jgi:AcrR family transcriptional regulator
VVVFGTGCKRLILKRTKTASRKASDLTSESSVRERVLRAAFSAFTESGYEGTSTLEIATRAKVSKREIYILFEDKQAMLTACISERASRMRQPLEVGAPVPSNTEAVAATLVELGISILRVVCHPDVLAIHRLAIAESDRAPTIASTLDGSGREANHAALAAWMARTQAQSLIGPGDPTVMATHFLAVLWGGLLIQLLLRVRDVPTSDEMEARAYTATKVLLALYPPARRED